MLKKRVFVNFVVNNSREITSLVNINIFSNTLLHFCFWFRRTLPWILMVRQLRRCPFESFINFTVQNLKMSLLTFVITQPAFTCSKLTVETLGQGVKHVQSQQWTHQTDANGVVLVPLLLILNIFYNTLF